MTHFWPPAVREWAPPEDFIEAKFYCLHALADGN